MTGAIFSGDLIYSVNGKNVSKATHDEVVDALRAKDEIHLVLVPANRMSTSGPAPPSITTLTTPRKPQAADDGSRFATPARSLSATQVPHSPIHSPPTPDLSMLSDAASVASFTPSTATEREEAKPRLVKLVRSKHGYGMKIRSDPNVRGVRVSDITPMGAAMESKQVFPGDVILEINGIPMLDADHSEVVAALVAKDDVTLLLQAGDLHPTALSSIASVIQRRTIKLERQGSSLGIKIKVNHTSASSPP